MMRLSAPEVDELVKSGAFRGGMPPKLGCALDTVKVGVRPAHIIDDRVELYCCLKCFQVKV